MVPEKPKIFLKMFDIQSLIVNLGKQQETHAGPDHEVPGSPQGSAAPVYHHWGWHGLCGSLLCQVLSHRIIDSFSRILE